MAGERRLTYLAVALLVAAVVVGAPAGERTFAALGDREQVEGSFVAADAPAAPQGGQVESSSVGAEADENGSEPGAAPTPEPTTATPEPTATTTTVEPEPTTAAATPEPTTTAEPSEPTAEPTTSSEPTAETTTTTEPTESASTTATPLSTTTDDDSSGGDASGDASAGDEGTPAAVLAGGSR